MKRFLSRHRPTPAMFVAIGALVAAGAGTAGAAAMSVHKAQVAKHKSSDKKQDLKQISGFFTAHRAQLVGPAGPPGQKGDTGPKGDTGATGAQGPAGATNVVVHTGTSSVAAGGNGTAVATCPGGTSAIAGGGNGTDSLRGSYPSVTRTIIILGHPIILHVPASDGQTPDGWNAAGNNTSGSSETLTAFVVCASP